MGTRKRGRHCCRPRIACLFVGGKGHGPRPSGRFLAERDAGRSDALTNTQVLAHGRCLRIVMLVASGRVHQGWEARTIPCVSLTVRSLRPGGLGQRALRPRSRPACRSRQAVGPALRERVLPPGGSKADQAFLRVRRRPGGRCRFRFGPGPAGRFTVAKHSGAPLRIGHPGVSIEPTAARLSRHLRFIRPSRELARRRVHRICKTCFPTLLRASLPPRSG